MSTLNKVMLIGNLGKDPEIKNFDNGGKIASFSIATLETYKKKDTNEKVENTEWHNISVRYDKLVDVIERYLKKGDKVYIEGKLKTRSWEKDGDTKYITEVIADKMTMLNSKSNGG